MKNRETVEEYLKRGGLIKKIVPALAKGVVTFNEIHVNGNGQIKRKPNLTELDTYDFASKKDGNGS